MLKLESTCYRIKGALLLDHVSIDFQPGETVAIVGPNGAGKSTLLRLLSGDLGPTSGHVLLADKSIAAYTPRELAMRRAVLSQHIHVSFPFTVEEIVRMGGEAGTLAQTGELIEALLAEVELSAFRHRDFPTLSGGEQQRAHFARTLLQLTLGERAHGKGILLLDEPTSSLDLRHQIKLLDLARAKARAGTTVIAVLHDLNLAVRFADRIVVLKNGCIAADGHPASSINSDVMEQIFGISTNIRCTENSLPFVLQQDMAIFQPSRQNH
ncbi:MAG: heme ABC transporter ATP-binding protein [Afipia felis]|nr:heme ABC transporter ATP-binding protein [Afipia felis]